MPNVRTHDTINMISAAVGNAAYFAFAPKPEGELAILFTGAYLFAGYACAGDLDLDSTEYRRWGRFRFLWWPYKKMIPHRSRISHGLLLGGVVRALYLAVVCTLLFWVLFWLISRLGLHIDASQTTRAQWQSVLDFARARPDWTVALLGGFILAGTTHSLADSISTWLKRKF